MPHESEETYNLFRSGQVMTDSVWTKRECPRVSDRVDKPMENACGVSHNLTTLIHPLPTLRRIGPYQA